MRERLVVSVFIAILVHFVLFLVLQLVLKIEKSRVPEYSGPLYVTFEQVPSETPVMEREQEARQLPRVEREQPRVEQQQAEQAEGGVAPGLPRVRSVPAPETTKEPTERPRTGLRFLDSAKTPASDERYLPPEEEALQSPPAERQLSKRPSPDQAVPVPPQAEVRPEEEGEQPSVLDLRRLDSSLGGEGGAPAGESGSREGGPAAEPTVGAESTAAQKGREGIEILFDEPSQGRDPTYTPRPQIPAWVSEQGLHLQVVVTFVLTPQGFLRDVNVRPSSGYSDVDAAVLDALRRWKFPPVSSTRTVTGRVRYTIIPD